MVLYPAHWSSNVYLSKLLVAVVEVHGVVSGTLELVHIVHRHTEDEDVIISHLLCHLETVTIYDTDLQGSKPFFNVNFLKL